MPKLPSTRFPFINLSKALERAKALYDADRAGKGLKMPVAFSALGYSSKSSGGFQTIAALRGYGLTDEEGANDDRMVRLSQLARRYFQTEIEDDQEMLRADFAMRPPLFKYLLEHWQFGTVADPVARTYLKTEIGLNEQSARSALSIYKDNLPYVSDKGSGKILERDTEKEAESGTEEDPAFKVPLTPPVAAKIGDRVQWTSQGVDQFPVPRVITDVVRDPERGWFVTVRGSNNEKGTLPMEEITVIEHSTPITPTPAGPKVDNPIEIFLTATKRLQITADIDRAGIDELIQMLEAYKIIIKVN